LQAVCVALNALTNSSPLIVVCRSYDFPPGAMLPLRLVAEVIGPTTCSRKLVYYGPSLAKIPSQVTSYPDPCYLCLSMGLNFHEPIGYFVPPAPIYHYGLTGFTFGPGGVVGAFDKVLNNACNNSLTGVRPTLRSSVSNACFHLSKVVVMLAFGREKYISRHNFSDSEWVYSSKDFLSLLAPVVETGLKQLVVFRDETLVIPAGPLSGFASQVDSRCVSLRVPSYTGPPLPGFCGVTCEYPGESIAAWHSKKFNFYAMTVGCVVSVREVVYLSAVCKKVSTSQDHYVRVLHRNGLYGLSDAVETESVFWFNGSLKWLREQ